MNGSNIGYKLILSKSEYMMFLKHPAWLWLKKHDPAKLPLVDANTQAIFDAGHAFETYAEELFPAGVRLGFDSYGDYLTLPARTTKALRNGAKTIYQGRFEHQNITFIGDIITVVGDKVVDLYEIKSSTCLKPEHELDLAFQLVVLEVCGYSVRNIKVLHVNNQYVRRGDIDPQKLVTTVDITESVKAKRDETKHAITRAMATMNAKTMPDISPSHCGLNSVKDWLTIYRTLTTLEPGDIYDLCSASSATIGQLEKLGISKLTDIPDDFKLTVKQSRQVRACKENKAIIEQEKIKQFLATLQYPLYFLDYETLSGLVPSFDGLKPYQQLPFQYSLHILDSPDGELRHHTYLHDHNSNPAESLSQSLSQFIGEKGSILVWYEGFERARNSELAELLPDYAEFYQNLNARIVDLMLPFSEGWYTHKDFAGSASIKKVLPVLVPELSYNAIDIQDGTSAQRLWMEAILDGKHKSEKTQILSNLTEYCKLDTLAMVKIYEHLTNLSLKPANEYSGE